MSTTPTEEKESAPEEAPIDYHPDHAGVFLRAEDLRDEDFDCDVDIVVDGNDVELRLAATLEDVEKIAGREFFVATLHARDFQKPEEYSEE